MNGYSWRRFLAGYVGLAAVLVGLITLFSLTTSHFFTLTTFRTIANQIPSAVLIAVGMTFVLIIAQIDLSVGSVMALSSALLGKALIDWGMPLGPAVACCLALGLLCGAVNGWVTVHWSLPSFIVTLGMLEIARGGSYLLTDSQTKYIGADIEIVAETSVLGLSLPFLVALSVVAAGQFVLSRTVFGRYMIAIGTNEEAVRLSGINSRPIKLGVFLLCSGLASLAAVIHTSRLASSDPNSGIGWELDAIAAVVVGGTSLMGGRGSVIASFFGVLIIAVLGHGLAQMGVQEPSKRVVTGCVIVAAVIIDSYRHRLQRKPRPYSPNPES